MTKTLRPNKQAGFIALFLPLFLLFYYFNIAYLGIVSPGRLYSPFLAMHFNYINWLRFTLIKSSSLILSWFGFTVVNNNDTILVAGHGEIEILYDCLGLGIISFIAAFVLAYPKPWLSKITFLLGSIVITEALNVLRFVLLALFWNKRDERIISHHTIFNLIIYAIVITGLYFWVRGYPPVKKHATH